jgi:DMSO/TMAO reductase YedYZ molybdopterin-dependent catalytic subunit
MFIIFFSRRRLMKRILITLFVLTLFASACTPKASAPAGDTLLVKYGDMQKTYTLDDLQALGDAQATFQDVTYVGIPLSTLLSDAGADPASLSAVKVVAVDGYTVNYDSSLFMLPNTLVAYSRLDGPLAGDEVPFRMVLPDQEGKLNARQLVEIDALP